MDESGRRAWITITVGEKSVKVVEVRSGEDEATPGAREPGAIETGAAVAGCGLGCVREIIWIGILLIIGYALLATCTGMV